MVRKGAALIPCLVVEEDPRCYHVEIGRPVPDPNLQLSHSIFPPAAYLLKEMMSVMERLPDQCGLELLNCIESESF